MARCLTSLSLTAAVAALWLGASATASAATSTSGPFVNDNAHKFWRVTYGDSYVQNNMWGSGYGPQQIWANSLSNFWVNAAHPNSAGIKSYPSGVRNINRALNTLGSLNSGFSASQQGTGKWDLAYDVWGSSSSKRHAYETMIWYNWTSGVGPLGSQVGNTWNVGGSTWRLYVGSNGQNAVYSLLRTTKANSGSVDIRAVQNWLATPVSGKVSQFPTNAFQTEVENGWEITTCNGGAGQNFTMNSFWVSYN